MPTVLLLLPKIHPPPLKYQLIGTEPGISTAEVTATGEIGFDGTVEPGSGNIDNPGESSGNTPQAPNLGLVVTAQQGGISGGGSSNNNNNNSGGTSPTRTKSSSSSAQTAAATSGGDPIIILKTSTKAPTLPGFIVRTATSSRTPAPTKTPTASRTKFPTATIGTLFGSTPTRTPTTAVATNAGATQVPLVPSSVEYDDEHPLIAYSGWNSVSDVTAYHGTLHVSVATGSAVTFRFTGQQIRLKFQETTSSAIIRINIGGLNFDLDEGNGTNEWVSVLLAQGTYTVTITHSSGGSVNLDSIFIPDLNTPTPSATPTATATP
ncbi:MAG: hypothetical protein QM730_20030 [Anaerolineales bacterium]